MRTWFIQIFVCFACWLVATPALAQPGEAPTSETPDAAGEPSGDPSTPVDEPARKSEYQRHLDNGVKLYRDGNYPAAIAEFQEAYKAEPKASPLINLALSYKKLFQYAKAIKVLEQALGKHAETMKPVHKQAAETEARELKALLAWVTVRMSPPTAQLFIDDERVAFEDALKPLALSPGGHKFRAQADGYKELEVSQTVTSGMNNPSVTLTLQPTTGELIVTAFHANAWIEVDGKMRNQGTWKGPLAPGVHAVRVLRDGDAYTIQVVVQEGGRYTVTQSEDGELESNATAPLEGSEKDPFGLVVPEILRGFYGLGGAAMLTSIVKTESFVADERNRWGAAGGLHLGYRVANWAAFEGMGQFSDVRVEGTVKDVPTQYTLQTVRFAGMMRIMLPGHTMVRFVATVGAGLLIESLHWKERHLLTDGNGTIDPLYEDTNGIGPFAEIDLGVEVELSNVLIDLMVQNSIQSTKHFDHGEAELNAFDGNTHLVIGPGIRVGYGLW